VAQAAGLGSRVRWTGAGHCSSAAQGKKGGLALKRAGLLCSGRDPVGGAFLAGTRCSAQHAFRPGQGRPRHAPPGQRPPRGCTCLRCSSAVASAGLMHRRTSPSWRAAALPLPLATRPQGDTLAASPPPCHQSQTQGRPPENNKKNKHRPRPRRRLANRNGARAGASGRRHGSLRYRGRSARAPVSPARLPAGCAAVRLCCLPALRGRWWGRFHCPEVAALAGCGAGARGAPRGLEE
jgi:hypothetical protein